MSNERFRTGDGLDIPSFAFPGQDGFLVLKPIDAHIANAAYALGRSEFRDEVDGRVVSLLDGGNIEIYVTGGEAIGVSVGVYEREEYTFTKAIGIPAAAKSNPTEGNEQ